jgi:hypothetical protein
MQQTTPVPPPQAIAPASPEDLRPWYERFTLGGYGEIHYNQVEGSGKDQIDLHRLVLYLGYEFSDWIVMHSETEFEHGKVEDGDGELKIEQWHLDFLFSPGINVRAGRYLQPLGIVNRIHEPPTFFGVERSAFDTFIIPSTWSGDGVGLFGEFNPEWKYEVYLGSSLDGSQFSATKGIRDGRMFERPGLSEPAFSGRLSWLAAPQCQFGFSFFQGGLNNGDEGINPGIDADLTVLCIDGQTRLGALSLRGAAAVEYIDGAETIGNNVGERIEGYTLEAGYHFFPEAWRQGRAAQSDAAFFVRYDSINTQAALYEGSAEVPAADRQELTFGFSYWPIANLVLKADYQIRDDRSDIDVPELFNLGIGWQF